MGQVDQEGFEFSNKVGDGRKILVGTPLATSHVVVVGGQWDLQKGVGLFGC